MHSYEERILAVELYYRYGKKASVVVMELGYPSTRQLSRWVRMKWSTKTGHRVRVFPVSVF